MPTNTQEPTNRSLWPHRADYSVGKTRRQRQEQYRSQVTFLIAMLALSAVAAGIFAYLNWRGAGSTKAISCTDYPQYCVPLAGGMSDNETASTRELDQTSRGTEGVVRGFTSDHRPFIGNPNAPVHFRVVPAFSCSHCREYHEGDLDQFIRTAVLHGKATLELNFVEGTGGFYSKTANQAALCAGEQGAFWEMTDELYRLSSAAALEQAFSLSQISDSARKMDTGCRQTAELHQLRALSHPVIRLHLVLQRYGR